jgi:hypothetical protein
LLEGGDGDGFVVEHGVRGAVWLEFRTCGNSFKLE